jgi:hypothetical protein
MIKSVNELIFLLLKDERVDLFYLIFLKCIKYFIFHSLNLHYLMSLKSKYFISKYFLNLKNFFLLKVLIIIIGFYFLLIIYIFDL